MEGDPVIRWQTLRDLLDRPAGEVAAERASIADEAGARLLALQHADGFWAERPTAPTRRVAVDHRRLCMLRRAYRNTPEVTDPGRNYARRYTGLRKGPVYDFVEAAVRASGGRVVFSSGASTAPLFLGVEDSQGDRFGVMAYVFSASGLRIKNRPATEHRGQIRYGDINSAAWREAGHPLGFDPAGLDLTVVLVVDEEAGVILGLDPVIYDPLPLANSVYFKASDVEEILARGWQVREHETRPSKKKNQKQSGLETVVGFTPSRFLDFLRFERQAQELGLDQPLRFAAAERMREPAAVEGLHQLERDFKLSPHDLFNIIERKRRLAVAVRGGVAEHHLGLTLARDTSVRTVEEGETDGPPDFHVVMADGRPITIECKNASPKAKADGTLKVEIQKTRASKGDPLSRFYAPSSFDVVAACLFGPTRKWEFRFCRSSRLNEHSEHQGRIAPIQPIDDRWSSTLSEALDQVSDAS